MSIDFTQIISDFAEHASRSADVLATVADTASAVAPVTEAVVAAAAEPAAAVNSSDWARFIGAAVSMIGAMAVGASQGYAAGTAAAAVGRNPEAQPKILNTMIVGMAITEAVAIYCFIIAILLIFVA